MAPPRRCNSWSPGEWVCDRIAAHRFIHDEAGRLIADFPAEPGITPQRRTANAMLATASPTLYDALELCRMVLEHARKHPDLHNTIDNALAEQQARAALLKANPARKDKIDGE